MKTYEEVQLHNSWPGHYLEVSSQFHAPASLSPQYQLVWKLEGGGVPDAVAINKKKLQGLVRQRTIPTERPPLVGKVSANESRGR
jgi:hypothetical protein